MEQTNHATPAAHLPLYEPLGTSLALHEQAVSQTHQGHQSSPMTTISQYSPAALGLLNVRLQALQLGNAEWNIVVEPGTERHTQRFIGSLSIGQDLPEKIVVHLVEPGVNPVGAGLPSKKDVKAVLAQKALVLLENMLVPTKRPNASTISPKAKETEDDGINWIGRILVLTYTESSTLPPNAHGPTRFSCLLDLSIPTSSLGPELQSFRAYTTCRFPIPGTPISTFSTKKAAKYHCSRLAGLELVKLGLLQDDGTTLPKPIIPQPPPPSASNGPSLANFIPQRCHDLGLPPPRYEFVCVSGDPSGVNAFVDCSAHFPPIDGLPDPLVVVRNVFGKKRAREECARALVARLDKVEAWRWKGGGLWEE